MSTFRQEQIQELLNYERSMNRIVLDREIAQVSGFNDERSPPSNRDIKFEGLLGNLVDALKAKLAEALTSIASEQNPKMDALKATTLLDLDDGAHGMKTRYANYATKKTTKELQEQYEQNYTNTDAPANDEAEEEEAKEEEEKKEDKGEEDNTAQVNADQMPDQNLIDEKNMYDIQGRQELGDEEDEEEDNQRPVPSELSNMVNSMATEGKINGRDNQRPVSSELSTMLNLMGTQGKINGRGRHAPKRRRFFGGDENEKQTDRTGAEKEKSKTQHVKATENVLYDCITQYNGIVDKLNQVTMPDGRFASRRTASQQSISYYADVFKGLLEPVKHLIFELIQVRNPQLATTLNMMTQMKELIEISPPFQKININAYKNGMPDFQGLNGEVSIDVNGYLDDLKEYMGNIIKMKNQVDHQLHAVLFNIRDPSIKSSVMESLQRKNEHYQDTIKKIEEELRVVKLRKKVTDELQVNTQLIKDAQSLFNNLQEFLSAPPPLEQEIIDIDNKNLVIPGKQQEYNHLLKTQLRIAEDDLKKLEEYRRGYEEEAAENDEVFEDKELNSEINKRTQQRNKLLQQYSKYIAYVPQNDEIVPYHEREENDLGQPLSNENKVRRQKTPYQIRGEILAKVPIRSVESGNVEEGDYNPPGLSQIAKRQGIKQSGKKHPGAHTKLEIAADIQNKLGFGMNSKGGSGGLADLLSTKAQPQYWHHRQLSDMDAIRKQTIADNKRWQEFSNPPHTNPVGSLYPFDKKTAAELYSFPLKLKHDLAQLKPDDTQKSARGADISLLQGPLKPTVQEKIPRGRKAKVTSRTAKEATNNILQGKGMDCSGRPMGGRRAQPKTKPSERKPSEQNNGYGPNDVVESSMENMAHKPTESDFKAAGRKSKALHKLKFDDEDNEMFDNEDEMAHEGMIPEEEPEQEDRFRNRKLGPVKKKSVKK